MSVRRDPGLRGERGELPDRFATVERDTYRVFANTPGSPGRINPVAWVLIAVVSGALLGRLAIMPNPGKMVVFLSFLAFTTMAVLRPVRAVQLYLVLTLSGQASFVGVILGGATFSGGDLMVIALASGWALSRERRPLGGAWSAGIAVVILGVTALVFAMLGLGRGNAWQLVQIDLLPFLHLLAFFPLAGVLQEPEGPKRIAAAVGLGVGIAAVGSIATFFQTRNATGLPFYRRFGLVFPGQGPGGGSRVVPFADGLMPLGLLGGLALSRAELGPRARTAAALLATLCGTAILISYTRSLILPTLVLLGFGYVVRRREPGKWGKGVVVAVAVLAAITLVFPVLSGRSLSTTLGDLGDRFSGTFRDESYQERSAETAAAIRIFGQDPFIGRGFGASAYIPGYAGRVPSLFHNLYAGLLAKTGAIGLVLVLGTLGGLLARAARLRADHSFEARLMRVAAAWLAGLMLAAAATNFLFAPVGIIHIALTAALVGERMAAAAGGWTSLVIGRPAEIDEPFGPDAEVPRVGS